MEKETQGSELRVLVADHSMIVSKMLSEQLTQSGFAVEVCNEGHEVPFKIEQFCPHFILVDLTMPKFSAIDCLSFIKQHNAAQSTQAKVLVLSTHNSEQNIRACLNQGASDYIVKPIKSDEVIARIALQLRAKNESKMSDAEAEQEVREGNFYLHLASLLVKTIGLEASAQKVHFQLIRMLSMAIKAQRISLVELKHAAKIMASSDDEHFTGFKIDIEKYPEIDYVKRTEKRLLINKLNEDESFGFIKNELKSIDFNSMILLPIKSRGRLHAVLSIKIKDLDSLNDADFRLCQLCAELISSYYALNNNSFQRAS